MAVTVERMQPERPYHSAGLVERIFAALRLDVQLYVEVSTNREANGQSLLVVVLSGLCNGLGLAGELGGAAVSAGVAAAVLGWLLWALVIVVVARLLGNPRQGRSVLRGLAFANTPSLFLILGTVPAVGALARVLVVLWLLGATVVAVQAVFELPRRRATIIAITAFVVYLVLGVLLGLFAGL